MANRPPRIASSPPALLEQLRRQRAPPLVTADGRRVNLAAGLFLGEQSQGRLHSLVWA